MSGSVPARVELAGIIKDSLPQVELATLLAIILIIGLVYRSVVAPVLTVVIAGISLLLTTRAAPLVADAVRCHRAERAGNLCTSRWCWVWSPTM